MRHRDTAGEMAKQRAPYATKAIFAKNGAQKAYLLLSEVRKDDRGRITGLVGLAARPTLQLYNFRTKRVTRHEDNETLLPDDRPFQRRPRGLHPRRASSWNQPGRATCLGWSASKRRWPSTGTAFRRRIAHTSQRLHRAACRASTGTTSETPWPDFPSGWVSPSAGNSTRRSSRPWPGEQKSFRRREAFPRIG